MELYGYLLIVAFTVLALGESIAVKTYARKYEGGGMIMNAVIAFFAALFFIVTDTDGFHAPVEMLPYAIINGCMFAAGFYFTFVAFKIGPYGLTSLISKFALLFPIFYGIFFLNENTTALTYIGIVMMIAAMVLANYSKKEEDEAKKDPNKVSLKWFLLLSVSVIANGFIGILTKMQQIRFNDTCSKEFQAISIGLSFVFLAVMGLILDRDKLKNVLKHGTLYGMAGGICNGAKNFIILIVYTLLPLSVVSPVKAGFGIISAFLVSVLFYKEKYSLLQKIGVLSGIASIIILAL